MIEVDSDFNYVDWFQKCFIHHNFQDQTLLDTVLSHNQNLNNQGGTIEEIQARNKAEYDRILALGAPIIK